MTKFEKPPKGKLHEFLLESSGNVETSDKPLSFYMKPKAIKKEKVVKDLEKVQSEDAVKAECIKWLRSQGWEPHTIYTGGIPTGRGTYATNPAKGIPDCIAFNFKLKKKVWIEWKKSHGGIVSQEQKNWHAWLWACGDNVLVINSLKILKEKLYEI